MLATVMLGDPTRFDADVDVVACPVISPVTVRGPLIVTLDEYILDE